MRPGHVVGERVDQGPGPRVAQVRLEQRQVGRRELGRVRHEHLDRREAMVEDLIRGAGAPQCLDHPPQIFGRERPCGAQRLPHHCT